MIWGIVGGILLSLLASELYDSCPRLTNLLLRSASRRLPTECQDRYWEEWMGELDAQGDVGKLRKLGWAFWVFLSSWKTGRTLQSSIEQAKRLALAHQREDVRQQEYEELQQELYKLQQEHEKTEMLRLKNEEDQVRAVSEFNRVQYIFEEEIKKLRREMNKTALPRDGVAPQLPSTRSQKYERRKK